MIISQDNDNLFSEVTQAGGVAEVPPPLSPDIIALPLHLMTRVLFQISIDLDCVPESCFIVP